MARRTGDPARVFTGIGKSYERVATLLSFGQDARWRRALVDSVEAKPGDTVLDVATGTGMVARQLARRYGCRVVGLDQSEDMLSEAVRRDGHIPLVRATAERLPFPDRAFDHVTFTYLLRYVDDPAATLRELARVLRPGGRLATLEFGVPPNPVWRVLWRTYTRVGLPVAGRAVSESWGSVGAFLGPSIERFYRAHPQSRIERYWREAGMIEVATRRMSLGGGTVMSATRCEPRTEPNTRKRSLGAAFYALRPGGWRDYWTLLHPPYTLWHLSYVLLGAALAPAPDPRIVGGALLAFGLAVGVGAHAFDELRGRPLGTRIPGPALVAMGVTALAVSVALGVVAATVVGLPFLALVVLGAALVIGYAFELPFVHSDAGFALAWGAFPVVATASAVGAPPLPALVAAGAAAVLSLAQRRLSTRVRSIRRRADSVRGEVRYRDGTAERIDAGALIAAPESALRLLWIAAFALALGLLLARWTS